MTFACDKAWLVLHRQKALFLEDERRTYEEAGYDCQNDSDNLNGKGFSAGTAQIQHVHSAGVARTVLIHILITSVYCINV